jgi:hypothetical protein
MKLQNDSSFFVGFPEQKCTELLQEIIIISVTINLPKNILNQNLVKPCMFFLDMAGEKTYTICIVGIYALLTSYNCTLWSQL